MMELIGVTLNSIAIMQEVKMKISGKILLGLSALGLGLAASTVQASSITIEGRIHSIMEEGSESASILIVPNEDPNSYVNLGTWFNLSRDEVMDCLNTSEKEGREVRITAPINFADGSFTVETSALNCELLGKQSTDWALSVDPFIDKVGTVSSVKEAGMLFYQLTPDDGSETILLGAPFEMTDEVNECLNRSDETGQKVHVRAFIEFYEDGSHGIKAEGLECSLQ